VDQLSLDDALGAASPVDLCGCQPTSSPDVLIATMHDAGLRPAAIAHRLNAAGVATGSGRGRWHPETVQRRQHRDAWALYMRQYRARIRG
jgi:hypothetical protein